MPHDNIFDASTGQHVAWIDDGKVFNSKTGKQVATTRDGNIYSLEGQLVGHLESAWQVPAGQKPDAFRKLLQNP